MIKQKTRILTVPLCFLCLQCVSTHFDGDKVGVQLNSQVEDSSYGEIISKQTRSVNVYENFETIYTLRATYLDQKTMREVDKKGHFLAKPPSKKWQDPKDYVYIFVSLYTPEQNVSNSLIKKDKWHIYSGNDGKKQSPISIKRLKNKEYWKAFFPYIDQWSEEYLIEFDKKDLPTNEQEIMEITFSHKSAKTKFKWQKS